ncbi:MAG: hypothetical protein AABX08_02600 [Nanoarchaeota archaeon]
MFSLKFLRKTEFDKELIDYFGNIRKKRINLFTGLLKELQRENAKEVINKARK